MIINIIGCGAQAKYVEEICKLKNIEIESIFSYGDIKTFPGIRSSPFRKEFVEDKNVVLCFSSNLLKKEVYDLIKDISYFPNIIHPKAIISTTTEVGKGCIINPGAILQPYSRIGDFTMIHSGSIIEHNCEIGNFCNVAPGVILAGWVKMKEGSTIYSNSTVVPTIKIGKNSVVGANSLILDNVSDNSQVYGIVTKRKM